MAANALDDIVKRLTTPEIGKSYGALRMSYSLSSVQQHTWC